MFEQYEAREARIIAAPHATADRQLSFRPNRAANGLGRFGLVTDRKAVVLPPDSE